VRDRNQTNDFDILLWMITKSCGMALRPSCACCEFNVIGEADNGAEAVQIVRKSKPHMVLMDISLPVSTALKRPPNYSSLSGDQGGHSIYVR